MLIELSYILNETMPKWPTNPSEKYHVDAAPERGDANNASSVYHHLHNGTHVDAPHHFDPTGRTIDQLPVEDFYYTAPYVLELPKKKGETVDLADLRAHEREIKNCDILLIYTGYCDLRQTDPAAFADDFPSIAPDAARALRKEFPKLKAVALDFLSADSCVTASRTGFPSHHALLDYNEKNPERTLLIFEDVNVKKLLNVENVREICAFPIRWAGLEAGPVAMVAVV